MSEFRYDFSLAIAEGKSHSTQMKWTMNIGYNRFSDNNQFSVCFGWRMPQQHMLMNHSRQNTWTGMKTTHLVIVCTQHLFDVYCIHNVIIIIDDLTQTMFILLIQSDQKLNGTKIDRIKRMEANKWNVVSKNSIQHNIKWSFNAFDFTWTTPVRWLHRIIYSEFQSNTVISRCRWVPNHRRPLMIC